MSIGRISYIKELREMAKDSPDKALVTLHVDGLFGHQSLRSKEDANKVAQLCREFLAAGSDPEDIPLFETESGGVVPPPEDDATTTSTATEERTTSSVEAEETTSSSAGPALGPILDDEETHREAGDSVVALSLVSRSAVTEVTSRLANKIMLTKFSVYSPNKSEGYDLTNLIPGYVSLDPRPRQLSLVELFRVREAVPVFARAERSGSESIYVEVAVRIDVKWYSLCYLKMYDVNWGWDKLFNSEEEMACQLAHWINTGSISGDGRDQYEPLIHSLPRLTDINAAV